MSCAERIRRGEQSLHINRRVALEIGQMLTDFLLTASLRRFAAYFDLESGTSNALYVTPEQLKKTFGKTGTRKVKKRSAKRRE